MDTIELGQKALQQESLRRLERFGEIGAGRNARVVPDDWKWEFLSSLILRHNALGFHQCVQGLQIAADPFGMEISN